jgi:hypothetical protein
MRVDREPRLGSFGYAILRRHSLPFLLLLHFFRLARAVRPVTQRPSNAIQRAPALFLLHHQPCANVPVCILAHCFGPGNPNTPSANGTTPDAVKNRLCASSNGLLHNLDLSAIGIRTRLDVYSLVPDGWPGPQRALPGTRKRVRPCSRLWGEERASARPNRLKLTFVMCGEFTCDETGDVHGAVDDRSRRRCSQRTREQIFRPGLVFLAEDGAAWDKSASSAFLEEWASFACIAGCRSDEPDGRNVAFGCGRDGREWWERVVCRSRRGSGM